MAAFRAEAWDEVLQRDDGGGGGLFLVYRCQVRTCDIGKPGNGIANRACSQSDRHFVYDFLFSDKYGMILPEKEMIGKKNYCKISAGMDVIG